MRVELEPRDNAIEEDLREFVRQAIHLNRGRQREVDRAIRREFAESFTSQGNAAPWAQLAEATVVDRVLQGYPPYRPILIRTGDYMRSWTQAGDPDHIFDYGQRRDGWTVESGSDDYRAIWHEYGTRFMPARPVAALSGFSEHRLRSVVDDLIDRIWERVTR